ncbi:N-alpha-acetyltransferase 11 [Chenopodium quinoa]|uniref:N-alpha-acetyltransferase 11 n=1 Tax=Chenopodium quinoa TaxID=63459 RepID=UPI000B788919|nr:N-alpha-acetyltransferase 11 [Chenopodium quinoa]XP_021717386.1 N-alpha-acetyltransferase 11 [Chenopodium quinoa]
MAMLAEGVITELNRKSPNYSKMVEEVVKMEKKIFPKHESLSRSFDDELSKKNAGLLYAYVNGEVAGYAMYSCPTSLQALISKLAVKEKYRRQGYGEALLREAIRKCQTRKIQRISLHVDPSRTPAVDLYKKLGFRIDSLVAKYYSADRDAYRMYLDLSTSE